MPTAVHYIPIVTTIVAVPFAIRLFRHWRSRPEALYLSWWFAGVVLYGVGTFTESLTTLLGWNPVVFKAWYISGALLGGAPLAQGSVYLLFSRRAADVMAAILIAVVTVAASCVLLSPLDVGLAESHRLSGEVLTWQWVRLFSPFINTYAFVFLVGGAAWSAWRYFADRKRNKRRVWGNVLIAVGALLPGIGGAYTRAGFVEVLYVTELIGILTIWAGYQTIVGDRMPSVHTNQKHPKPTLIPPSP
jgi:hypothetical protein